MVETRAYIATRRGFLLTHAACIALNDSGEMGISPQIAGAASAPVEYEAIRLIPSPLSVRIRLCRTLQMPVVFHHSLHRERAHQEEAIRVERSCVEQRKHATQVDSVASSSEAAHSGSSKTCHL